MRRNIKQRWVLLFSKDFLLPRLGRNEYGAAATLGCDCLVSGTSRIRYPASPAMAQEMAPASLSGRAAAQPSSATATQSRASVPAMNSDLELIYISTSPYQPHTKAYVTRSFRSSHITVDSLMFSKISNGNTCCLMLNLGQVP